MALQRRFPLTPDQQPDPEGYAPMGEPRRPGLMRRAGMAEPTSTTVNAPTFQAPYTPSPTDLGTNPVPTTPAPTSTVKAPGSDPSTWNTNGYRAPGYAEQTLGQTTVNGYDRDKLAKMSHQSPKYAVGRILTNFPDTPEGLQQALGQIQRAYPGTTVTGSKGDKLNIPGVGVIDVGLSFGEGGGKGWAWQPVEEEGITPYQTPGMAETAAPVDERSAILDMLEGTARKPLRTARYRAMEA